MSKKISGAEYPLSKIFSAEFEYQIPAYQRPYAWTDDETLELFDDLYDFHLTEPADDYFLGSIVLIKQEAIPQAQVIDGQQRLTTLTILLAAIASKVPGALRDTVFKYIQEPGNPLEGLDPKPRLTLRPRDQPFFAQCVQQLDFNRLASLDQTSLDNEAQQNIQVNSRLLLDRLEQRFGEDSDALQKFAGFLLQRCYLVAVSTPNQKSAFRVFSVMNNRGLDLQPTDIVKAEIIGQLPEAEQEDYTDRWEAMEAKVGRGGFNDLFAYTRMIFAKSKAKRTLLEEFREQVQDQVGLPAKLIENILEPYSEAQLITRHCNYSAEFNAEGVNNYLRWLNRIDNSDWVPAAILFLSQFRHKPEYVLWFFRRLERLAAYMHVCARNINQRIERYADLLTALEGEHGPDNPIHAVDLTESEKAAMRSALNSDVYSLTARRRNYLLLRLDSFLSDGGASYEASVLTIEHVLPQTVESGSPWLEEWPEEEQRRRWVHRLANLVPLNQRRNSQAHNYGFERKKKAYFGGRKMVSSYVLTSQVLNAEVWTPEVVAERQERLLEVLADHWDLGESVTEYRRDEHFLSDLVAPG